VVVIRMDIQRGYPRHEKPTSENFLAGVPIAAKVVLCKPK